mgnify:CR=1 FL=1
MHRLLVSMGVVLVVALAGCSSDEQNGELDGNDLSDGNGGDPGPGADQSDPGSDAADDREDGGVGPDMPICDEVELDASPVSNLLLVVDKSDSMNNPTAGSDPDRTKMDDLRDAVHVLLDEFSGKIRFGWMAFPYQDDCDPGVVSVEVGNESAEAIGRLVDASIAWGGTPTGGSLQNARAYQGLHDTERSNFVLLVTDGMPTCPEGQGMYENDDDNALALQAVVDLYADGIGTFVVGLGEDINSSNPQLLSDMAESGGYPRAGSVKYHQANSLAELKEAFSEIARAVFDCSLALDVVPEKPEWIWVYFDGQPVSRDRQDGFDYDPQQNTIDFFGQSCDRLANGEVGRIDVKMGCRPPD